MEFADAPLPKGKSFCVRIVDAEDFDIALDPIGEDIAQSFPESAPIGRLEVERIDVLILFWWVFRVLDGAVGANVEPVGMLRDPGVVRGTLEGDVEGNLHAVFTGRGDESVEVAKSAERGVDGLVAPLFCADGPRAARIVFRRGDAVVRAFAKRFADGMDRRHIENIEAHCGDVWQKGFYVGEGAVAR